MKKVGLFFGSFNPIHMGHLILANYMLEFTEIEELWFVITPVSPFKQNDKLLDNNTRYQLIYEAILDYPSMKASKVEFDLEQPNYTINTLAVLEEQYPEHTFSLIMGSDNLQHFHKWKNAELILDRYPLLVYPRAHSNEVPESYKKLKSVQLLQAPIVEISASFIRNAIKEQKDIRAFLPPLVWEYIDQMNLFK
ncbi:MAG: nicotinate-nucleotide adenylyltransferase [Flavobacteriaceae bacterium]|jgi:nicotinate-nucleotide adenylyltransferase|nr:nicotinate-nucleotide adenylyltransferase [Flavobacteriaceae bacterium]NVJ72520.1 nicotinate-nucleotide adenylyltransferase [Flavobacteriaceae bacterium]